MRLTNQSALAITRPEGRPQITVFDDEVPGFGVRVSAKTRVWIISYRNKLGQSKQETIGRVGLLTATEARKAAADMLARVRLGSDPHTERKAAKKAAAVTFGSQIEAYLEMRRKDVSASYHRDLTRSLNVDLAPLHKVPVADMTHGQVHEQIERIARDHPHAAKQARAGLSRFFKTMVSKGIAPRNPVVDVETPATPGARDRVLKDDELIAKLVDAKQEAFNLRFRHATGELENTARLGIAKRDVARLLTVARSRGIDVEKETRRA